MAGGSREQQTENDRQCVHCGLWYGSEGLLPHERNCDMADYDARLVELIDPHAKVRAPDVEEGSDAPMGPAGDAPPDAPEARTDGGPMPVPDFAPDDDRAPQGEHDDRDEPAEHSCPSCGSTRWFDPDELPERMLDAAPAIANADRACIPCSTTEDGHLAETVEVYDVDGVAVESDADDLEAAPGGAA